MTKYPVELGTYFNQLIHMYFLLLFQTQKKFLFMLVPWNLKIAENSIPKVTNNSKRLQKISMNPKNSKPDQEDHEKINFVSIINK